MTGLPEGGKRLHSTKIRRSYLCLVVWPAPLERGAKIALVAASRRVTPAEVRPFLNLAHLQGWKVEYDPPTLFAQEGLLAGPDTQRLQVLQQALDDPSLHAIWFARGGHGSSRIWPRLSWASFQAHPKWLIGFSDVTPFLWGAVQAGVCALHGPVAAYLPHRTHIEAVNRCLDILRSSKPTYTLRWTRQPWYAWRSGQAQGPLLGGNLTLLQTLCGTPLDLRKWAKPPLLFWEEVGEYLYRLDRMSWHLRNAGWYDYSKALLVGELTLLRDEEDTPFGKSPSEILSESAAGIQGPLLMGLPVGHSERNWPLVLGALHEIEATESEATLWLA